jgi:hypothetical protein
LGVLKIDGDAVFLCSILWCEFQPNNAIADMNCHPQKRCYVWFFITYVDVWCFFVLVSVRSIAMSKSHERARSASSCSNEEQGKEGKGQGSLEAC